MSRDQNLFWTNLWNFCLMKINLMILWPQIDESDYAVVTVIESWLDQQGLPAWWVLVLVNNLSSVYFPRMIFSYRPFSPLSRTEFALSFSELISIDDQHRFVFFKISKQGKIKISSGKFNFGEFHSQKGEWGWSPNFKSTLNFLP